MTIKVKFFRKGSVEVQSVVRMGWVMQMANFGGGLGESGWELGNCVFLKIENGKQTKLY